MSRGEYLLDLGFWFNKVAILLRVLEFFFSEQSVQWECMSTFQSHNALLCQARWSIQTEIMHQGYWELHILESHFIWNQNWKLFEYKFASIKGNIYYNIKNGTTKCANFCKNPSMKMWGCIYGCQKRYAHPAGMQD